MKICYVDESGTGDIKNEPYSVMVGIIVDASRMNVTKNNWESLLRGLSNIVNCPITEIHTRDFYSGNGIWRSIKGEVRKKIIDMIFEWLVVRKHEIVYTAVDRKLYEANFRSEPFAVSVGSYWNLMALHIAIAIQKHFKSFKNNKGNTILIFDNENKEEYDFVKLINKPPQWTDSYYSKKTKQEQLDQIVDVPYFGDSKQVALLQVADFISYFIRKYIEIQTGVFKDKYADETQYITNWATTALECSIPKSNIFLSKGRCECAELFYKYAPTCLSCLR